MGFISGLIDVVDHLGRRLITPNSLGRYQPVRLKLWPGASTTCVDRGDGTSELQIAAPSDVLSYATSADFRAATPPADGTFFRVVSPAGEYRYSTSSGAGWADDNDTILKPDSVLIGSNGRAFSTRASAHAATFTAARSMKGLVVSGIRHVHIESHTTFGDGGGGVFDVKDASVDPDNDGTVIQATSGVFLKRRDAPNGNLPITAFGCDPTGASFSDTGFAAALVWLHANPKYRSLKIPDGRFKLQNEYTITADQATIIGNGRNSILDFSGGPTKSLFLFTRLCSGLKLKDFRIQGLASCGKAVLDCSTGTGGWLEFDIDLVVGGGWTYWLYATEDGAFQRGAFQWGRLRLSNLQDGAVGDPHNYAVNGIYLDGGYFNACPLIYVDATGLTGTAIHIRQMTGYSGGYCSVISGSTQTCNKGMYIEGGQLFNIENYAAEGNVLGDTIKDAEFLEFRRVICNPLALEGVSNSLFSNVKGPVTQDADCYGNDFDRSCSASTDPLTRQNLSDRVRLGLRTTGHLNREPAGFGSFDPQNILLNGDTSRYVGTLLWGAFGNYAAVKCGDGQADTTRTRNAKWCALMGPAVGNVGPWIARFKISPALDASLLHCKVVASVKWKLAAGTGAPAYVITDNTSIGADIVTGYGGEVVCENGFTIQTVSARITQAMIDNGLAFVFFGTNTQNFYVAEVTANIGEVAPRIFHRCERSPFFECELNPDGVLTVYDTAAPAGANDPIMGNAWQENDVAIIRSPVEQTSSGGLTYMTLAHKRKSAAWEAQQVLTGLVP